MQVDDEVAALKERVAKQETMIRFLASWLCEVHTESRFSGRAPTLFGMILRPVMRAIPSDVAAAMVASGASPAEALVIVAREMPQLASPINSHAT